ncbi:MAG TPA: hypothetical protein VGL24_05415 [Chthoniobacterales bacterium]|jgi:hypothetical protein
MRRVVCFCLTILSALAIALPALAETDQEVAARAVALDLAGAFSNDGFKLRDGHWTGTLAPAESKVIAVNLYAGNEYWFSAGATDKGKKVTVEVFNEKGEPVAGEKFNSGTKAASGVAVENSGQYFIRVRLDEGGPAGVCFVYSYK